MKRLIVLAVLAIVGFYAAWPAFSAWQIHQGLASGNTARLANKIDFDTVRVSLRPTVERETEHALAEAMAKAGPVAAALGPQVKEKIMPKLVDRALATLVTPEVMIRIYREGNKVKDTLKRIVAEEAGKMGGLGGLGGGLGSVLDKAADANAGDAGGKLSGVGAVGAFADKLGGGKGLGGLFGKKKDEAAAEAPAAPATPAASAAPAPAAAEAKARPFYGLSNIKALGLDGLLGLKLGVAKDPAATEPDITAHMAFSGFDWKLVGLTPRNRLER